MRARSLCFCRCRWRDWQLNLSNVAQAVLFVLLIWVVDRAVGFSNQQAAYLRTERHPEPVAVGGIPACRTDAFLKVRRRTRMRPGDGSAA